MEGDTKVRINNENNEQETLNRENDKSKRPDDLNKSVNDSFYPILEGTQSRSLKGQNFETSITNFNPDRRPPNVEMAKRHGIAKRVAPVQHNQTNHLREKSLCMCCGLPIENEPLPISCSRSELVFLGSGFPLYFEFLIYCIIILALMIGFQGIYGFISNHRGDTCKSLSTASKDSRCDPNFITTDAASNKSMADVDDTFSILNLISVIGMMLLVLKLRHHHKLSERELDRSLISPSDFTLMVKDLPLNERESDIKEAFENIMPHAKLNVKKICLAYHIADYIGLRDKKIQMNQKLTNALYKLAKNPQGSEAATAEKNALLKMIKQCDDDMDALERDYEKDLHHKFCGVAFISFNTEEEVSDVQKFLEKNFFEKYCGFLVSQPGKYKGRWIRVARAAEPKDVLWENLGYNDWEKNKSRIITSISTLLLLGVCGLLITLVSLAQEKIRTDSISDDKQGSSKTVIIGLFSFVASFVIMIINFVLSVFIRKFANYEKHDTYTFYSISFAKKLGLAQFLNTAIISFIVNIVQNKRSIWVDGGLVHDAFSILLMNAYLTPLMNYFNPFYVLRLIKRQTIIKQGDLCQMTQLQANEAFEGTPFDLSLRYSNIIKTMLLAAFYAPVLPIGLVFSISNIFLTYWIDKYLLLRRHARPQTLGPDLSDEMIDYLIELIFVVFSVGCILFEALINDQIAPTTIVQVVFSIFYFIFPFDNFIVEKCFSKVEELYTASNYEKSADDFEADYDRCNPATTDKAMIEWFHRKLKKNLSSSNPAIASKSPEALASLIKERSQRSGGSNGGTSLNFPIGNRGNRMGGFSYFNYANFDFISNDVMSNPLFSNLLKEIDGGYNAPQVPTQFNYTSVQVVQENAILNTNNSNMGVQPSGTVFQIPNQVWDGNNAQFNSLNPIPSNLLFQNDPSQGHPAMWRPASEQRQEDQLPYSGTQWIQGQQQVPQNYQTGSNQQVQFHSQEGQNYPQDSFRLATNYQTDVMQAQLQQGQYYGQDPNAYQFASTERNQQDYVNNGYTNPNPDQNLYPNNNGTIFFNAPNNNQANYLFGSPAGNI